MPTKMPGDRLRVFRSRSDNSEVIVCHGWVDTETCHELERAVDAAFEEGVWRLRLDLGNVLGIDEAGMRCLLAASERCRQAGAALELVRSEAIHGSIMASDMAEILTTE
jgi:anti-anti-sigma factor